MINFNEEYNETKAEFPSFEVLYKKDSSLMKAIDILLKVITFGQMKTFMTGFTTTIGNKIYVSNSWDDRTDYSRALTLIHERQHMRQRKWFNLFGMEWTGHLIFSLCYLFLPLPFLLAWFRYKLEIDAYAFETASYIHDIIGDEEPVPISKILDIIKNEARRVEDLLTGPSYFWTWCSKKQIGNAFKSRCIHYYLEIKYYGVELNVRRF